MSIEEHEKKAKDAEERLAALENVVFGAARPAKTTCTTASPIAYDL